ncbi:outer membrane protein [Vibrio ichthyoenteri ATCC 700023]|uniref:Outer membrane protein n=1 Tax=Vibrio ichthyoenteri ATCC 700023 TaxID=870968 RepID=F9S7I7_9VIBR|nr:OmpA family protein [Vibrio ichthyoenteri]EGU31283.1 outer membrane protein [Vibrio ichthyoenteri ATCC 700023]
MYKPALLGVASLLLTACASEPKTAAEVNPILIIDSNNPQLVTVTKTTDVQKQIAHLQITNHELAVLNKKMDYFAENAYYKEQPRQFIFHYSTNGTTASFTQIESVLEAARTACRIDIQGRTDGQVITPKEKEIAQKRASNVRDQLVKYGVKSEIVFTNYAPSGDYVGDNWTEDGRAQNRRVEIDVYTACR